MFNALPSLLPSLLGVSSCWHFVQIPNHWVGKISPRYFLISFSFLKKTSTESPFRVCSSTRLSMRKHQSSSESTTSVALGETFCAKPRANQKTLKFFIFARYMLTHQFPTLQLWNLHMLSRVEHEPSFPKDRRSDGEVLETILISKHLVETCNVSELIQSACDTQNAAIGVGQVCEWKPSAKQVDANMLANLFSSELALLQQWQKIPLQHA